MEIAGEKLLSRQERWDLGHELQTGNDCWGNFNFIVRAEKLR